MTKEYSVVQVVAKRFQAGASDDVVVLHPTGHYFFHIPGDPFHLIQNAVKLDDGMAIFQRPVYLFHVEISGNSYHQTLNCQLDAVAHDEGCEQTFRHMGYQLQGLTDYRLCSRAEKPINIVRFCVVIETVGYDHPEAGWVVESQFKGWLNVDGSEELLKAVIPIPQQFVINP